MMNSTTRTAVSGLCADLATVVDVDGARADVRAWAGANASDPAAGVAYATLTAVLDQHRAALCEPPSA
jgi:hypothetical protein